MFRSLLFFWVILTTTPTPADACPPPGTSVPFVKVSNPSFAPEYNNCNITTIAEFFASTGIPMGKLDQTHFSFIVVPPNDKTGGGRWIAAPKQFSDLIFSLKPGQKIRVRGGNYVDSETNASPMIPIFVATSVELVK
jgi:hypothetical protein